MRKNKMGNNNPTYNILFMGTPDFALRPLEVLYNIHNVVALVCQPNRVNRRGNVMKDSPTKEFAVKNSIPVYQPENINSDEIYTILSKLDIDFIVVVAYGQYIGKKVRDLAKEKIINLHASLLPKYRGAAPIHRAIMNRDSISGNSIMEVNKGMDQGEVYLTNEIPLDDKTLLEVHDELSMTGADLLVDYFNLYRQGNIKATVQDENKATYAEKISREDGILDFERCEESLGKILGLSPKPGAVFVYKKENVKAINARIHSSTRDNNKAIGEIIDVDENGILVNCGDGQLLIERIQFPGKKIVNVADYLLGNTIEKSTILR